jgi:hypothetical protein
MNCPYCAQQINVAALECPFCHKDLVVFAVISARLARLDQSVETVQSGLRMAALSLEPTPNSALAAPVIGFAASVLFALLFDYMNWQPFAQGWIELLLEMLSTLAPLFAAVIIGLLFPRIPKFQCYALGLAAGAGGFAVHLLVWVIGHLESALPDCVASHSCDAALLPSHWYVAMLIYPLAGFLVFPTGAAWGEHLRHRRTRKQTIPETSEDRPELPPLPSSVSALPVEALIGFAGAVAPPLIDYFLKLS